MLDGYKTNPKNEIRKINDLLKERVSYDGRSMWEILDASFHYSELNIIETDLKSFYTNLILKNPCYEGLLVEEIMVLQYRFLCELILNLLYIGQNSNVFYPDVKEIIQIKGLIKNGLELCGYKIEFKKKHYVTRKTDIHAEAISIKNKEYKEYIFDYLIAKTLEDKESALLNLCNKLEAEKAVDTYTRHVRDYVQFLRHPEERKKLPRYSWFYKKESYLENLEKLFKILLTYIGHLSSFNELNEFDKNCSI